MANMTTNPQAVPIGAFVAEVVKLDQGVRASLPAKVTLMIYGVPQTQAAVDARLQAIIARDKAVDDALAAYRAALVRRSAELVADKTYVKGLKHALRGQFGPQHQLLASFGIPTDKALTITSQQRMVAAAKRTQTRKARGTMGKKQRAKLTVVGNPPVLIPSTGPLGIAPPPVNIGVIGTNGDASFTQSGNPTSGAANTTTLAPGGSGSGGGGSSTPTATGQ